MEVGEAILAVGAGERPASLAQFSAAIDPQWIAEALAATGTASVRRRKLPADHLVWLVIGIGLFHDRSIAEVVHHLDLVLPPRRGGRGRVSNAAIVQARDQLGAAPLAALFTQTATAWTAAVAPASGGTGWPSTASTAPRCASPIPPRISPPSGGPQPRRGRRGLPARAPGHAPQPAPSSAGGGRSGRAAHRRTRASARGVGHAPRARGGHPRPRLLQLRSVPCARDGRKAVRQQVVEHFAPGDAPVELRPTSITCAKHPDLPPTPAPSRAAPVLDHEHACLAVDVQSHVAFHRAALLKAWAPARLSPWSTANRIAAEGSPSSLLRLSAIRPDLLLSASTTPPVVP